VTWRTCCDSRDTGAHTDLCASRRDPLPDSREFDSLGHIAETARREDWPTGKALVTARVFLRSEAANSQAKP
jgi:hypothetical protein